MRSELPTDGLPPVLGPSAHVGRPSAYRIIYEFHSKHRALALVQIARNRGDRVSVGAENVQTRRLGRSV